MAASSRSSHTTSLVLGAAATALVSAYIYQKWQEKQQNRSLREAARSAPCKRKTNIQMEGLPEGKHLVVDEAEFARIFIHDIPLLDVRAPVEFEHGAFPNATNIPLMTNQQREAVGTTFTQEGHDEAILLGAKLVTQEERHQRKQAWAQFFQQHCTGRGAALYCFRGGLRSQISQQWILEETGIQQPRINGGYKAMRRFLMDSIERIAADDSMKLVVLGGKTGSGKTRILNQLTNAIDLEGLANHRGSAFGPTATPQPTQINFENRLAIDLLKREAAGCKTLILEDEALCVGYRSVPACLWNKMQLSPLVMLEVSQEERNINSIDEFVVKTQVSFEEVYGKDKGEAELNKHILTGLNKIKKRLGDVRHDKARAQLEAAIELRKQTGETSGFIPVVKDLLVEYYDPMYQKNHTKDDHRVVFRGGFEEVLAHLTTSYS